MAIHRAMGTGEQMQELVVGSAKLGAVFGTFLGGGQPQIDNLHSEAVFECYSTLPLADIRQIIVNLCLIYSPSLCQ